MLYCIVLHYILVVVPDDDDIVVVSVHYGAIKYVHIEASATAEALHLIS